jgi:hypothetical protein
MTGFGATHGCAVHTVGVAKVGEPGTGFVLAPPSPLDVPPSLPARGEATPPHPPTNPSAVTSAAPTTSTEVRLRIFVRSGSPYFDRAPSIFSLQMRSRAS